MFDVFDGVCSTMCVLMFFFVMCFDDRSMFDVLLYVVDDACLVMLLDDVIYAMCLRVLI